MSTRAAACKRLTVLGLAAFILSGFHAQAQRTLTPAPAVEEPVVTLQRIEGVGPRARVPTPQYRTSVPQGRATAGAWGQIAVVYDTAPEWIDDLTFQYYALLVREVRGEPPEYSLFRGAVTYMDVPRGRGKESTAFLRPNTLLRHGAVIAVAVEVLHQGETIATLSQELRGSVADGREQWWRNPNLTARDGHILNRSQTPFTFVNFDEYETIRP